MFDIAPAEFLLLAVVALVVIGPKDLPKAMRFAGQWVGRARAMARHFRTGIDTMIREAELEEMEAKWAAENQRIMSEHPAAAPHDDGAAAVEQPPSEPIAPIASPAPPAPAPAGDEGVPSLFAPGEMPALAASPPVKRARRKKAAP